jgi:MSHA biogenesis protein MshP
VKQYIGKQRGFTLIMAIFIVVVLALLGSYMVRLSGVQYSTASYALQSARAYQAGRAGLGWATATINNETADGLGCSAINTKSTPTSPLTLPDMPGFTIKLTCDQSQLYTEGSDSYYIYKIKALSEFGNYSSEDYVSRTLEKSVIK